jgi:hypothetical protein
MLHDMVDVGLVEGLPGLTQIVDRATKEYIRNRQQAPTFPEELENARLRQEMLLIEQQNPKYPPAPKDIV